MTGPALTPLDLDAGADGAVRLKSLRGYGHADAGAGKHAADRALDRQRPPSGPSIDVIDGQDRDGRRAVQQGDVGAAWPN